MVGPFEEFGVVDIRQCLLGIRVFLESSHFRRLILGEVALGIEWGCPPLGDASVSSAPASLKTK
jgi:hypothetical protein